VTQQNQDPTEEEVQQAVDAISQDQESLDADQGAPAQPTAVTLEQMQQFFHQQLQPLVSQVQGLHSKVDTGLNAVRRDVSAEAKQLVDSVTADIGKRQFLASLDEDMRPMAEGLLAQVDARMPPPVAQPQYQQPPPAAPQANAWEEVYQVVEGFGLNRHDPNVNYQALSNAALTPAQQREAFMGSIRTAIVQSAQGQQAPQPRQTPQAPVNGQQTVNPPVERGGGSSQQPLRTEYQIYDAFLANQLNSPEDPDGSQELKRRLASLG